VSIRDLARFVRKASASARAIWQAPLHYRPLQDVINSVAKADQPLVSRISRFNINLHLSMEAKRQMQLDVESQHLPKDSVPDGSLWDRLICFPPDTAATEILQLETRSRGRGDRCFPSDLVSNKELCQPSKVSDSSMLIPSETTDGQADFDHSTLDYPALVSNHSGTAGGLPSLATSSVGPSITPNSPGVHQETGSSQTSYVAHLRKSFASQGISPQASGLLLSSWSAKTKSNYNFLFAKWADWCHQWNRNPTAGPIEDIINFLAELFNKGYQYCSLKSYHSAISSVHAKVDGESVGQHPLVMRILKGAFNERPPLPRYSNFWDVGVVLRYLKQLGANGSLTLRLLTIKSTMLLALTRPSRSVDLSKLDISSRTFTAEGKLFKA